MKALKNQWIINTIKHPNRYRIKRFYLWMKYRLLINRGMAIFKHSMVSKGHLWHGMLTRYVVAFVIRPYRAYFLLLFKKHTANIYFYSLNLLIYHVYKVSYRELFL